MYSDIAACALHPHRCCAPPPIKIKLEKFGIYLVMSYGTDGN